MDGRKLAIASTGLGVPMNNEQRVQNPKSPYFGKPYDELPPLPPPPAPVVRNQESRYYGMTLKKSQRLHHKLYPSPSPSEPELKSFKTVKRRLSPEEKEKL